jgi:hypothetical protein
MVFISLAKYTSDDPLEIQERDLLRGHPSDYFSLIGGSHTSVIDIKESQDHILRNQHSYQTLRAEVVQSLYNKNCVNAKLVFWYNQSQKISMWFCFQGWLGANVANTWSSKDLCQLLTSNQLLAKLLSWTWIETQFHKTDQMLMLQTSNQV